MRVFVEDAGSGPAILCLHGIGSSAASFGRQIDTLARHRRVLAWDAPGYGRSDDPPEPVAMDGYADTAASVLSDRDIERAHVVGVSFGGVVAVRLAIRHPGLVRSLVVADSTPGSGQDPASAAAMRRRAGDLAGKGPAAFAAERAARLLSPSAPRALIEEVERNMAQSIRLPGYRWAAEAMADTDHSHDFAAVTAPTLVLCGTEDRVTPPSLSEVIARAIPGARLQLVHGAGHLSNQEQPEKFNALVEGFLDEVERLASTTGTPVTTSREEQR